VVGAEVVVVVADKCAISSWKEDVDLVVWTFGLLHSFPDANRTTDNCKNEHPTGQNNSQSQGGFGNRFAALNNDSNQGSARNRSGAFGSSMFAPSFWSLLVYCACYIVLELPLCAFIPFTSTIALRSLGA